MGFERVTKKLPVTSSVANFEVRLEKIAAQNESVTVTADVNESDVLSPDPGEKVFVRQDLLDANPGRPGASVSIPGYPIETASSGIKAPRYFAPGVAGDHGEPIAQYVAVGSYLAPDNLSANAHGNGYSDPNMFIPEILESVKIDGGRLRCSGREPLRKPGRNLRTPFAPRSFCHHHRRLSRHRFSCGLEPIR